LTSVLLVVVPGRAGLRASTLTSAYSMSDPKTNVRQTIIQRSIALMYETRGRDARAPLLIVVVVSTVSRPMVTRAGLDSTLIQKDTHDSMTMRMLGT